VTLVPPVRGPVGVAAASILLERDAPRPAGPV